MSTPPDLVYVLALVHIDATDRGNRESEPRQIRLVGREEWPPRGSIPPVPFRPANYSREIRAVSSVITMGCLPGPRFEGSPCPAQVMTEVFPALKG